jgi:hypothetical protein
MTVVVPPVVSPAIAAALPQIPGLSRTIPCPCTLYQPAGMGQFVAHQFVVNFRRVTGQERDSLKKRHGDGELSLPAFLDEVVEGWEGMLDANSNPVPYSHAVRQATNAQYPGLEEAMVVAWFDNHYYLQRDAAAKNSAALSGTGTA